MTAESNDRFDELRALMAQMGVALATSERRTARLERIIRWGVLGGVGALAVALAISLNPLSDAIATTAAPATANFMSTMVETTAGQAKMEGKKIVEQARGVTEAVGFGDKPMGVTCQRMAQKGDIAIETLKNRYPFGANALSYFCQRNPNLLEGDDAAKLEKLDKFNDADYQQAMQQIMTLGAANMMMNLGGLIQNMHGVTTTLGDVMQRASVNVVNKVGNELLFVADKLPDYCRLWDAAKCDLRLMMASRGNTEADIIERFKEEFESKKKQCAVLIVRATSDSEKWTVAGFNDVGQFRTEVIDDPNHKLWKELKRKPIKSRIVYLATSVLGRTPAMTRHGPVIKHEEMKRLAIDYPLGSYALRHLCDKYPGMGRAFGFELNEKTLRAVWTEFPDEYREVLMQATADAMVDAGTLVFRLRGYTDSFNKFLEGIDEPSLSSTVQGVRRELDILNRTMTAIPVMSTQMEAMKHQMGVMSYSMGSTAGRIGSWMPW